MSQRQTFPLYLLLTCFSLLGIGLRLYLFDKQLITDDEWHAVFRVADLTLWQAFTSFGHADHSIPMLLYDKFLSTLTPLNEFWLRLPSLLAGIALLLLLPHHIYRQTQHAWLAVFTLALIACSPLLVQYSRMARPYAISLLCAYTAHIYFHRYWQTPTLHNLLGYAIPAAISTWALAISGFFVIAPFFYILPVLYQHFRTDKPAFLIAFKKALTIGIAYSVLTLSVLLPPLLTSYQELTVKSGQHLPTLSTYLSVWFVWFGTWSNIVVLTLLALALIGAPSAWRTLRIYRTAVIGCALILLSIYASQPAWIHIQLTFARYLLPSLPVLLISIAFGMHTLISHLNAQNVHWISTLSIIAICTSIVLLSHLPKQLRQSSGHSMTGYYMLDPRKSHNLVRKKQDNQHYSDFWTDTPFQPDINIALAPYYFISYDWRGVMAEKQSQRRILPAFLNGFCRSEDAVGEPSLRLFKIERIRLNNAVYLAQFANKHTFAQETNINWFVWQKHTNRPKTEYMNAESCDMKIDTFFGKPDYEDTYLKAYKLK